MTREEAIKVLQTEIGCVKRQDCARVSCGTCEFFLEESELLQAYEMAIAALREQDVTDINVGNKWISVKDKLPEDGVQVLACTKHGKAFSAHCEKGKWRVSGSVTVTNWMPMPEPPEVDV